MTQMIINGKQVDAVNKATLDVWSPTDGTVFTTIPRGQEADVDLAVTAARQALNGAWGKLTAMDRGRLLTRLSESILEHKEELAQLESKDTGKPLSTSRVDITVLARYFEFYGGAADKVHGETIPFQTDYAVQVIREPLGVTAHIIPWNYPAQMFGRSVAPALAMGNASVVKPAEDACLSIVRVAELALEVGFPPGALNVVTGLGEEAGASLSKHHDINFVTFTGSNEVGVLIQQAAALNAVKCVLELGGKSAHIVFNDANFKLAIPAIVKGIVHNTGQTCTAGSRLLVQEDIYSDFVSELALEFSKVRAGTPEMDLTCGPVVNKAQFDRVNRYIKKGLADGLKVVAEGSIADGVPKGGYFVKPTLFSSPNHDSDLLTQEIFGPVLVALPFKDEADAIRLSNATDYGLLGAVWTENGGRQQRVARGMKCGQVYINGFGAGGGVELPFGGVKKSGHGREKGFVALEEMSTTKTIVQYYGE
ncbi:aldehyde dehydrogenase family protein [Candidimonas sp. SYP-B2681]|uniref:aldehyde dehydrogenase family protein n=1 Tax=Candidimonas sp. SYP-B2681 TaxID=2497686 RepID=UPI000F8855E4|nr:aldehyde dehydrogenase family protein [Candidimonas sp. SYP-B2681]RTZ47755.1 aldehyde dehydrogenase family protein [Candidimonas sp. SYP-B2681]